MDNTEQNIEKDIRSLDEQELEDVAGGLFYDEEEEDAGNGIVL